MVTEAMKKHIREEKDPFQELMDAAAEDDKASPTTPSQPGEESPTDPSSDNNDSSEQGQQQDPYQSSLDTATKISKDSGNVPEIIKTLKASIQQNGKVDPAFTTKLVNGLIGTQDEKLVRVARRIQDYLNLRENKRQSAMKKTLTLDKQLYEQAIREKTTRLFLQHLKENMLATNDGSTINGDPLMPKVRRAVLDAQAVVMDKLEEVIRKTLELKDVGTMSAEEQRLYEQTMKIFSEKVVEAFTTALRSIQHLPQEQEEPKTQQSQPPSVAPQQK